MEEGKESAEHLPQVQNEHQVLEIGTEKEKIDSEDEKSLIDIAENNDSSSSQRKVVVIAQN